MEKTSGKNNNGNMNTPKKPGSTEFGNDMGTDKTPKSDR